MDNYLISSQDLIYLQKIVGNKNIFMQLIIKI